MVKSIKNQIFESYFSFQVLLCWGGTWSKKEIEI